MKTSTVLAAAAAALIGLPAHAAAQQLSLSMQNGLVTLHADNVPVRQILAEWARVGGATIVNGDKVMGAPVTLQLTGVPERLALDAVLRGVSGYMLASRQVPDPALSGFDRILIMPTSSAPRAAPPPTAFTGRPMPRPAPQLEPEPAPVEEGAPDDDADVPVEGEPEVIEEPEVQPQPAGMNPRFQRPGFPNPMGGAAIQPFSPVPVPQGDEETPPQTAPAPGPLNVPPGASTMPGVIAPVPQQDEQPPPTRTRRPPG